MMKKNGFTLTEIMAVLIIISFLLLIAIPAYINISKGTRDNEYSARKKYLEAAAVEYASENNITGVVTITPARLIANGYVSADNYEINSDEELPFIKNPANENDNLTCHVITISLEGYDFVASMSDDTNCNFAMDETLESEIDIKTFKFEDNKIGDSLELDQWSNKDVLLFIKPNDSDIKSVSLSINGETKNIDLSNMVDYVYANSTLHDYSASNLMVIKADVILNQEITLLANYEDGQKSKKFNVKIDKEYPTLKTEIYDGWTSNNKDAIAYASDGNGSGAKKVYITVSDNIADIKNANTNSFDVKDGVAYIDKCDNEGLGNGTYYLWAEDNAGNITPASSKLQVKNVDKDGPSSSLTVKSNATYNSINTVVTLNAKDLGIGLVDGCISYSDLGNNPATSCNWKSFDANGNIVESHVFGNTEGTGATYTIYGYARDGIGNIKKIYTKYTLYKMCTDLTYSTPSACTNKCGGGTTTQYAYDKYMSSNRCSNKDIVRSCGGKIATETKECNVKCNGGKFKVNYTSTIDGSSCGSSYSGKACEVQDCCSSVRYDAWPTCSAKCNGGTHSRNVYSNYDGRLCRVDTETCNTMSCCDSQYLSYGAWSSCSPVCNGGTQSRTVTSKLDGRNCGTQTQNCTTPNCCSQVNYGAWSACAAPNNCGTGSQSRTLTSAYDGRNCGTQTQQCSLPACCTATWHTVKSASDKDCGWCAGSASSAKKKAKEYIKSHLGVDVSVSCSKSCTKTTWSSDDTRTEKCSVSWSSGNQKVTGTFYVMYDTNKGGDCNAGVKDRYAYVNLDVTKSEYRC